MKVAVRYYTKTGNTKKLAMAVAEALGAEALPISVPVTEPVDLLFLGNSYYAFNIDPEVRGFIQKLNKDNVGRINCYIRSCPYSNTELLNRSIFRYRHKNSWYNTASAVMTPEIQVHPACIAYNKSSFLAQVTVQ